MALPASRNTTYGAASAVKSADLNAIQDCIIGKKFGDTKRMIPGAVGVANSNTTREVNGYSNEIESSGATTITWPITFDVGDRIKSVKVTVLGNGVADITALDVIKINGASGAGTYTSTSLFNVVPAPNTPATLTEIICDCTDTVIAAGDTIFVGMVINAAGIKVYRLEVLYDHP